MSRPLNPSVAFSDESSLTHSAFRPKDAISSLRRTMVRLPTQEEIARRAFEIYVAGGCQPGQSEQDWLQAERELVSIAIDQGEEPAVDEELDDQPNDSFAFRQPARYPVGFSESTARPIANIA